MLTPGPFQCVSEPARAVPYTPRNKAVKVQHTVQKPTACLGALLVLTHHHQVTGYVELLHKKRLLGTTIDGDGQPGSAAGTAEQGSDSRNMSQDTACSCAHGWCCCHTTAAKGNQQQAQLWASMYHCTHSTRASKCTSLAADHYNKQGQLKTIETVHKASTGESGVPHARHVCLFVSLHGDIYNLGRTRQQTRVSSCHEAV